MYDDLQKKISSLPEPTTFSLKTFDELLAENVALAKVELSTENTNWLPLESDPYMKKLRVLTLRQIHNQNDKKETIKQLLITTATGVNLDHLGSGVNIFRDEGEYPYTNFEFTLLAPQVEDITLPAGIVLNSDDDNYKAHTVDDVTIFAGNTVAIVRVELENYTNQSFIKTERLITELTYALQIKQLDIFANGKEAESDDRYRLRIISSADRYSTAGSESAYIYHSVTADSRIDDIVVLDENVLDVNIYLASFSGVDELMLQRVREACNAKYVRPLGDNVIVAPAEMITLELSAVIEVFDLLKQSEIEKNIRANFDNSFFIGQNLISSDFIRKCHIDGVYRVHSSFEDKIITKKQIIKIKSLILTFKEAVL